MNTPTPYLHTPHLPCWPILGEKQLLLVNATAVGGGGHYATFVDADAQNDIDVETISPATVSRILVGLVIVPRFLTGLNQEQSLQIIASDSPIVIGNPALGLANDGEFDTYWAANQSDKNKMLFTVQTHILESGTTVGTPLGPQRVPMPLGCRYLNIRRDPSSGDVTRAVNCHIFGITQESDFFSRA